MPYIDEVHPDLADPVARREYDKAMRRAGRVWNIVSVMSPNGEIMRDSMRLYGVSMFGDSPLSRAQREMIAVVVSQANDCHY
jgi:alkylhydroperoxidase family enzyme